MPVHNVKSDWSGGDLYFFEKAVGRSVTGDVLSIRTGSVVIGGTSQDVDFGWYASGSKSFVLDAGAGTLTLAGIDVSITGDLTIDTEDINLGDNDDLEFGDSQDVLMRFSTADDSNHTFVVALDDTSQQMHITDKAAVATDWARSAGTHPEVAIHSNTTPITDYLAIGNHDGTTAHINVVGGTTLSLDIAGTAEVLVTANATYPATSDSNALGTGTYMWSDLFLASAAVINFNNGNVTITHSAGALAIAGAAITVNDAGADLDFRVESDNLAYALYVDAGKDCVVLGDNTDISDVDYRVMIGNVAKTLSAGESASLLYVAPTASTTEAASGTHGYIASAYFAEPNITHNAGGTITTAATVYIADAPSEANTNNCALYVASGLSLFAGNVTFGVDDTGVDVIFYGENAGRYVWWDPNGDTDGAWYFGTDTEGIQVNLYGDVTGCGVFWDPSTDTNGTLTIGGSGGSKGNDLIVYGNTNGNYLHWDQSADDLLLVGTATQLAVAGTTDASSTTTGSLRTAGGIGCAGKLYVGGDVNVGTNAIDIIVKANTATALEFYDSTTKFIAVDTRNTVTGVSNLTFTSMPSTITAASGVTKNLLTLTPGTTTLTGSTGVTAMNGLGLSIAQPTVTDEDAVTVTTASTVYIANAPTGAGSGPATLTNAYALYVAAGEALFAGAVTINEAGADVNVRAETNNMAYAMYLDGGKDSVVIGSNTDTSSADQLVNITRAARTATAATNYYDLAITPAGAVTVPSGTTALVSTVRIDEPNITATGTVTAAASLYIAGAPSEGTSNYALFVDGGNARFDGNLITASNVGSANTGVTAAEYGDGYTHTTVLTVSQGNALTTGDAGNLSCGYLLYTLPAGAIIVERAYMSMAITHDDAAAQADTPDVGVGTTQGTAAVATLDADNAACENIITGQTANDCNGTAEVKTIADQELVIESGGDHTIYFNAAATWSDVTVTTADIAGTVVLVWRFLA